ncbi:MAG: diguanylate cyclase [Peptococcaceae bacterium]|nr:diguanylate cyclase [Peptococcaceae bacterium]
MYHSNILLYLYIFSTAIALLTLMVGLYARSAPKSLCFTYVTVAIFILSLGCLFEITATSKISALMAARLQYCGGPFIAPLMLLFVCEYCDIKVNRSFVALLFSVPVLCSLLVLTYPLQHIYYMDVEFLTNGPLPRLKPIGSSIYYMFMLFSSFIPIMADAILLYHCQWRDHIFRKNAAIIVLVTVFPILGTLLLAFGRNDIGVIMYPIFLSLSSLLLCYSILQLGLYRIAPLAREQIIETMSNGFILADMQGSFFDANSEAKRLLPQLALTSAGTRMDDIEGVTWFRDRTGASRNGFSVAEPDGAIKYYRISETVIKQADKSICRCLLIYDETETKQLLDEVCLMAGQDALTGLCNQGAFFRNGRRLFNQIAKNNGDACVLMIDLDFFKDVNDAYGHLVGDEVLQALAEMLSTRFRSTDLVARYGGEEFSAFVPSLSERGGLDLAKNLRERAAKLAFSSQGSVFSITVSIGVTAFDSGRHEVFEAMLKDADAALYAAKKAGKNAIYVARAVPKGGRVLLERA